MSPHLNKNRKCLFIYNLIAKRELNNIILKTHKILMHNVEQFKNQRIYNNTREMNHKSYLKRSCQMLTILINKIKPDKYIGIPNNSIDIKITVMVGCLKFLISFGTK